MTCSRVLIDKVGEQNFALFPRPDALNVPKPAVPRWPHGMYARRSCVREKQECRKENRRKNSATMGK